MASDVKWIKICTDIFDDEKILMIESLPSADTIIVIWFKLLTMAGKQNNDGVFLMNNRIAYTEEMLASIFRRDINIVRLALTTFEQYGMIEIIEGVVTIPNWNKHQTLDVYERKKERDRLYQAERRAKQRLQIEKSSDNRLTSDDASLLVAVLEEDKEEEKEKDKEKDNIYDSDESKPPKKAKKAKKEKPPKNKYGEFQHVLLTHEETMKLDETFGVEMADKAVKFLDEYIEEKGYKSQSHYLAIRRWVVDAVKEKEGKQKQKSQSSYTDAINNRVSVVDNW